MCTRHAGRQDHHAHQHSARRSGALARKCRVFWPFAGFSGCLRVSPTRYKQRMSKGFTLLELIVVIAIAAVLMAFWVPRAASLMDWIETERAVRDVTTALAVGRNGAVMQSTRARVIIDTDTLRIDRLGAQGWEPWWRTPGPASHGVLLEVSNPVVTFG